MHSCTRRGLDHKTAIVAVDLTRAPAARGPRLALSVDCEDVSTTDVRRLQRTYGRSRLVELAAVAIAGLAVYHGCGLEIRNVALEGSGPDYLVDPDECHFEVSGRSRASDLAAAWDTRWDRLVAHGYGEFGVCVAEFETLSVRLGFQLR
ncbi:MAG: hypothetical protein WD872_07000 [Pirellulaceae bacterium]